ncbi:MAG: DUF1080 domain-containing protein [candidate division KSB1 bacterium]|nr:DUF1080 domain-containing protein [candidate division KSB1 bacterium]
MFDRPAHDRTQPAPPAVVPGEPSTGQKASSAPSDAVVLFDGSDLSAWVGMDGNPTKWRIEAGALECVPESGYIRSLQSFGDCQLHVEWAPPVPAEGESQGRGNSGVFFGLDRYEIQVLDSYQNETYADGSAGSLYGQYAPMVNASRRPGKWQSYDIIYTVPRFCGDGELVSPAYMTIFHNGVLIQNHVELSGPTAWINRPDYSPHPLRMPIALQDHGNPVCYRNIWVRELDPESNPEYYYTDEHLKQYTGSYHISWGEPAQVTLAGHGRLAMDIAGTRLVLFCSDEGKLFAKTTDVLVHFVKEKGKPVARISVGDGWFSMQKL